MIGAVAEEEGREDCGEGGRAEKVIDAPLLTTLGGVVDADEVRIWVKRVTWEIGVTGASAI